MKKILVISIFIVAAVLIYFVSQNYKNRQEIISKKGIKSLSNDSTRQGFADRERPPDVPEIFDLSKLIIDSKLKPVKLNLTDSVYWKNPEINLSVILPSSVRLCDIYLLINGKKNDMFYEVGRGKYEFKNIELEKGRSVLEVFYRIGKKRSRSSSCIVIRK